MSAEPALRAALDAVATPLFVIRDNRILFANAAALHLMGYARADLVNRPLADLVHHDDLKELAERNLAEVRLLTAHAQIWRVNLTLRPIDYAGEGALLGTAINVAEQALRESEQRYHELLESLPVAVTVIDLETLGLRYINPAGQSIYGLTTNDPAFFEQAKNRLDPAQHALPQERLERLRQGQTVPPAEYIVTLPGSPERNIVAYSNRITFEGRPCVLSIMFDVTEQKRAQRQAFELEVERERREVLERFLQHASHDLRTPITSLIASGYVAKRLAEHLIAQFSGQALPQAIQETLTMLRDRLHSNHTSAVRLSELVEAMLEMLRLDRKTILHFTPRDLNLLIRIVLERLTDEAHRRHLELTFQADDSLPQVKLDEVEFSNAMLRLIENAITYTSDGGQVLLRTFQRPGQVLLEIRDSGAGIEEADLPHIFEQFYRVDKARGTQEARNGLGLSIAKRIIEMHGGSIEVESTRGIGSVFRVILSAAHIAGGITLAAN